MKIDSERIAEVLIAILKARDDYTAEHSRRVAEYSVAIAERMGLGEEEVRKVKLAALLHDFGKIGVPDSILRKPDKLTEDEFKVITAHPTLSADILAQIPGMDEIARIIVHHHEAWDGRGYPDGLKGEEIPIESRIIAVAETIDILIHGSVYRSVVTLQEALEEIKRGAGTQFDPRVVEAAAEILNDPD